MLNELKTYSVGIVVGPPAAHSSTAWVQAADAHGLAASAAGGHTVDTPLKVNTVFYVRGGSMTLDYEGVRTGRYSRKINKLLVQVAVPDRVASDPDAEVWSLAWDALMAAEAYAVRKKITDGELVSLRGLLRSIEPGADLKGFFEV